MLTEHIEPNLLDLDQRSTNQVLELLFGSQRRAVNAVEQSLADIEQAVDAAASRLRGKHGRIVLLGAGASGRLAVQDGAELWPTYGWPPERLLLQMAGGERALLQSVEGVEDDTVNAEEQARSAKINSNDVVLALAASGQSQWTVNWLQQARAAGALTIGIANNIDTPLLMASEFPIHLDSGAEVLAGSTRMAAGTAQKIALNLFSTALMIRLNRTYGNLMVDMAAVNRKLDARRVRMLQTILPDLETTAAVDALRAANGWVKLAVLLAMGVDEVVAKDMLVKADGSLRSVLAALD